MNGLEAPDAFVPGLVPAPRSISGLAHGARLQDGLEIQCTPELEAVATWFRRELERGTGWCVSTRPASGTPGDRGGAGDAGVIRLEVRDASGHSTGRRDWPDESYVLRVGHDAGRESPACEVTAATPAGIFYGLQTLRQLLPAETWRAAPIRPPSIPIDLPGLEIADAPAFRWRGVHLDVVRHFMPKSFVLRLIDLVAAHKCNVLHLHLTDDQGWRIPVPKYPRLTEIGAWRRESPVGHYRDGRRDGRPHGGYYSTDDLREIVEYATERHVTVVPEIDMPGHMVAAIAAYPGLGNVAGPTEVLTTWGISEHVLNLDEDTIRFCTDVLDEVIDVFPSPYIHVGGDECPTEEWRVSEAAQALMREEGLDDERQLQGWFTARVAAHVAGRGRRIVGWDELLEVGAPTDSVIMSWRDEKGGTEAVNAGHDVVMAPQQYLYFDWSYADDPTEPLAIRPATPVERVYSYEPVPADIVDGSRVLGAQCQLWTEYVPEPRHAEYLYFPRLCAFSEVVWSGRERPGFADFVDRLRHHLARLDALDVNYRPLAGPTPGQARTWSVP